MDDEIVLLHQVHPVKLACDISASTVSNALLWNHRLAAGLAVRLGLSVVGSVLVIGSGDAGRMRDTAAGRYVVANMPPAAVAIRLAGDAVMAVGAWQHSWRTLTLGAATIAVGWSHGLWGATSTVESLDFDAQAIEQL